jgi:apolipoprotein N-acyltransferase
VRSAWLAAYALATFGAFPHPVGTQVVDLGPVLGWCAPGCLWLALRGLPPGRAARLAFAGAWAAHAALFHWIFVVTVRYGDAPVPVGVIAPIALALYPAAAMAAFGAGLAWLEGRRRAGVWGAALLWTAQDHLRSFALTGFPWGTLGYSQQTNAVLLAWAPLTGVYGLSFVVALGSIALAAAVAAWRDGGLPPRGVWLALAVVGLAHAGGGVWLATETEPQGETLRVAVLQGNIDQGVKWDRGWAEQTLQIYEDLSRRAAGQGAEAVLWPETAVPAPLFRDPGLRRRLATLARELKALLVVGGVGIDAEGSEIRFFDSAFAFDPQGQLRDRYDKSHLVPFGEYLPMRSLLGRFLVAVASGIASSDVSPGPGPRSLELPRAAGRGSVTVGVPICYELLFPDLVRRFVQDGAAVLFAVTNDAWYGRTGAPYQFLAMTALRSAETRVWTARAANTGVSAIIDHRGRVRARTRIFERDLLVADVPLRPPPRGGSLYTRYGDVFVLGCWMVLGLRAWPGRSRTGKGGRDEPVVDSHQPASR